MEEWRSKAAKALDELGSEASRVLDAKAGAAGAPQIWVASDGLDLAQKLDLERGLRRLLGAGVSVYFKRRAAGVAGEAPKVPAPPAPFGLKLARRAIPGVAQVIVVA